MSSLAAGFRCFLPYYFAPFFRRFLESTHFDFHLSYHLPLAMFSFLSIFGFILFCSALHTHSIYYCPVESVGCFNGFTLSHVALAAEPLSNSSARSTLFLSSQNSPSNVIETFRFHQNLLFRLSPLVLSLCCALCTSLLRRPPLLCLRCALLSVRSSGRAEKCKADDNRNCTLNVNGTNGLNR